MTIEELDEYTCLGCYATFWIVEGNKPKNCPYCNDTEFEFETVEVVFE